MFARHVAMHLKPGSVTEFRKTIAQEVSPLLRNQKGFREEMTLVAADGTEAIAISLWDQKENAEAYNGRAYSEMLEALTKVIDGTPQVHTYEVANSTLHKLAAGAAA